MNFFIANKELDNTIKQIKIRIKTSMNGVVADSMKEKGVKYKQNYGVNILQLKEIASMYTPNQDLALRLWSLQIRETMILATMLQPVNTFTLQMAEKWIGDIRQQEMAEQICMNLLSKMEESAELALKWTSDNDLWHQITGFTLISRIWQQLTNAQILQLAAQAKLKSKTDNFFLYKSIAQALGRLCRSNNTTALFIKELIAQWSNSEIPSEKHIYMEVTNELSFLNFL